MTNAPMNEMLGAGNQHARFDEGEVASENQRRGSLLRTDSWKRVVAGCWASLALAGFGFDADTLAFYDFKEGSSGESLVGTTILNGARSARNAGTPSGTCTFTNDAPAKYVFDTTYYGAELICTDPQSVHFNHGLIDFASLATDISSNDDYTVEFFFKVETSELGKNKTWSPVVKYDIRTHSTTEGKEKTENPMTIVFYEADASKTTIYAYAGDANNFAVYPQPTPANFSDGLWHHYAVVYSISNHQLTQYLDYGQNGSGKLATPYYQTMKNNRDIYNAAYVENAVQEETVPLQLGGGTSGFVGKIACLRVTKSARTPEQFMRASNCPALYAQTVFHYDMNGENGGTSCFVTNRAATGARLTAGQFWSTSLLPQDARAEALTSTVGILPAYTNETPNSRRKQNVFSGEANLGVNLASVCLTNAATGTKDGAGFSVAGTRYEPLDAGSFTAEMFVKFDKNAWLAKNGTNGNMRVLLIGQENAAYGNDWALFYEYQKTYKYFQLWSSFHTGSARGGAKLMEDGQWHHVAVVYDDATLTQTIYFDYVEVGGKTFTAPFAPRVPRKDRTLFIGGGIQDNMEGLIDEVRLSRRALMPDQFLRCGRVKQGFSLIVR